MPPARMNASVVAARRTRPRATRKTSRPFMRRVMPAPPVTRTATLTRMPVMTTAITRPSTRTRTRLSPLISSSIEAGPFGDSHLGTGRITGSTAATAEIAAAFATPGESADTLDVGDPWSPAPEVPGVRPSRAAAAPAFEDLAATQSVVADSALRAPDAAVSRTGSEDLREAPASIGISVARVFPLVLPPAAASAGARSGCPEEAAEGVRPVASVRSGPAPCWAHRLAARPSLPFALDLRPGGRTGSRLGRVRPRPRTWSLALSRSRSARLLPPFGRETPRAAS
jgi:hypothetical protein